jgi:hypothetical protein
LSWPIVSDKIRKLKAVIEEREEEEREEEEKEEEEREEREEEEKEVREEKEEGPEAGSIFLSFFFFTTFFLCSIGRDWSEPRASIELEFSSKFSFSTPSWTGRAVFFSL